MTVGVFNRSVVVDRPPELNIVEMDP